MEILTRLNTALAGRYEVLSEIGAGGMASVYLAHDVRHARKVVLKVLHPELSAVLGNERFFNEIRLTAGLQHAHILPLFDSGEADGLLYYVMPYVEGESLRVKLKRQGALPVTEALRIAREISEALEYAHHRGLVHRDIKPENVLFQDGRALVADFGIALAVQSVDVERMTQTGLSLGTPQYMAPEQAMGERGVGPPADVYALGVVTYEMLAGEPPFTGASVPAVLSRVLTERPRSVRAARPNVPEHVERALEQALEKFPGDRWQTAKEFAQALNDAAAVPIPRQAHAPQPEKLQRRTERVQVSRLVPWLVAATAVGLAAFVTRGSRPDARGWPSLSQLPLPDSISFIADSPGGPDVAISADGSTMAFAAVAASKPGIVVRRMDELEARFLRGTEEGSAPVLSPTGDRLLFTAGSRLRRISVNGGAATTVADSVRPGTASWGDSGEIVYEFAGALWRVPEDRGTPVLLARPDSSRGHVAYGWPHYLPGGKAALITLWKESRQNSTAELGVVRIPSGEVTELGIYGSHPSYVEGDYLVYATSDRIVFTAPFSLRRLRTTGRAVPVLEEIPLVDGAAELAISRSGAIVRQDRYEAHRQLVVVNRSGTERPLAGVTGPFLDPRVSPDGLRVALTRGPPWSVWVYDFRATTLTRLSQGSNSQKPEWTADGTRVAYAHAPRAGNAVRNIYWQPWDDSAPPEKYVEGDSSYEVALGPKGTFLAVRTGLTTSLNGTGGDIWIAPVDNPQAVKPFIETPAAELMPRVSSDGSLLAYVSDKSGRLEVYVTPLPGPGPHVPVSPNGGQEPVWARGSGTELFFRSPTGFVAATISRAPELSVTGYSTLFADGFYRAAYPIHANYDVLPGNQEFVMLRGGDSGTRILWVTNWGEELRRALERGAVDR